MIATGGGGSGIGSWSPNRKSSTITASTESASAAIAGRSSLGSASAGGQDAPHPPHVGHEPRQQGHDDRTASTPPRLTCLKVLPEGHPDGAAHEERRRIPDQRQHACGVADDRHQDHQRDETDAQRLRHANDDGREEDHRGRIGQDRADQRRRVRSAAAGSRLPLPPVARRNGAPRCSKRPVFSSTCATTMPPKSSASGPPADCAAARKSFGLRMPVAIISDTPSRSPMPCRRDRGRSRRRPSRRSQS